MENNINDKRTINSRHEKMSIENRAKQFAPFSALKGLPKELTAMEKVVVPRLELSEYMEEELNNTLSVLKAGDMADVIYFCEGEYIKVTGIVARIDVNSRVLQIVEKRIRFEDIYSIAAEFNNRT